MAATRRVQGQEEDFEKDDDTDDDDGADSGFSIIISVFLGGC